MRFLPFSVISANFSVTADIFCDKLPALIGAFTARRRAPQTDGRAVLGAFSVRLKLRLEKTLNNGTFGKGKP